MNHADEFKAAIQAAGITAPDDIIGNGKIQRFSSNGHPKDDAGWYVFHDDESPAGVFGCNRSSIEVKWKSGRSQEFTPEERAAWKKKLDAAKRQREADAAALRAACAADAAEAWARAVPAPQHDHPYLARKGITGAGARQLDVYTLEHTDKQTGEIRTITLRDVLLVPLRHGPGALVGLQIIKADGEKFFTKGTPAEGAYHVIGKPARDGRVVICEGYATAVSIHMATGWCCVVAFNAGNLLPVAIKICKSMPDADLVIGTDDDIYTVRPENHAQAGKPWNPGVEAAEIAARAVTAKIAWPVWKDNNRPDRHTDFNDLHTDEGLEAVKACFNRNYPAPGASDTDQADSTGGVMARNPVSGAAGASFPSAGPAAAPAASTGPGAGVTVFVPKHAAMMTYGLDGTEKGAYATVANVVRVLQQDQSVAQMIWYDEFLGRICTIWRSDKVREWSDVDDINLQIYLQENIGLPKLGKQTVADAVVAAANLDVRNEAKAYIEGIVWDGVERLPTFLDDCFKAGDSEYTRGAGENFWISMVARVMRPGCKVDTMLVLEGLQGAGKSMALAIIGGQWFAEANQSPTDKDFYLNLAGKMIIEIGEMDAFSRSEVTKVKQVITCQTDRYRAPYERRAADHPRRCVFAGTTNRDDWNKDETGARRFWPIVCAGVDHDALRANRDQYFAEAAAKLAAGANWWTMPVDATLEQQEARRDADELESQLARLMLGRADVTVGEIMDDIIKVPFERQDRGLQMRIGKALRAMKWTKMPNPVWRGGVRVRLWVSPKYIAPVEDLPF